MGSFKGLGCGVDWILGIDRGIMLEVEGWLFLRGGEGEDLGLLDWELFVKVKRDGALVVFVMV